MEKILEARGWKKKGGRQFKVLWTPCEQNNYGAEQTWESEKTLRADGLGARLDGFLRDQKKLTKTRKVP